MLLTLETDIVLAKNHSKQLQQNLRMNENGRERIKPSGFFLESTIFFYSVICFCLSAGPGILVFLYYILYVQMYSSIFLAIMYSQEHT